MKYSGIMASRLRHSVKIINILFIMILLSSSRQMLHARNTDSCRKVVQYVKLNSDNVNDTLSLASFNHSNFYLTDIKWSGTVGPQSPNGKNTHFIYPQWTSFNASNSIQDINNDGKKDLIFFIWGKVPVDSVHFKDTSLIVAIFNHTSLSDAAVVNLSTVQPMQTVPFVAMKLQMGMGLDSCAYRNPADIVSYFLNNSLTVPMPPKVLSVIENSPTTTVYPTPSLYYANVEIKNFSPGDYQLEIYNSNGMKVKAQDAKITGGDTYINQIDTGTLSNGAYLLVVKQSGQAVANIKMIVAH